MKYVSVMGILAINIILRKVLKRCVRFEKHRSGGAELGSLMTKLFFAQFFNTALVTLIVNGKSGIAWELVVDSQLTVRVTYVAVRVYLTIYNQVVLFLYWLSSIYIYMG